MLENIKTHTTVSKCAFYFSLNHLNKKTFTKDVVIWSSTYWCGKTTQKNIKHYYTTILHFFLLLFIYSLIYEDIGYYSTLKIHYSFSFMLLWKTKTKLSCKCFCLCRQKALKVHLFCLALKHLLYIVHLSCLKTVRIEKEKLKNVADDILMYDRFLFVLQKKKTSSKCKK